ncbi:DoxX family protein [Bdellovibrio sp. HCB337]|uniref:DoxX family protein n=1 Tax=Bdellovibrio sp. HCB337 TaxID=3394358 RepID=UPI0039A4DB22
MLKKIMRTDWDMSLLILRVVLGLVMFPHGAQKMLGWWGGGGFSGTVGFFGTMGVPAVFAILVILAEFLGSLGLIVGLLTRVAAFGIACVMLGAVFMVHLPNGFFMNWTGQQGGEGFEYHLLVLAMTVVLMMRGGGAYSLDRKIAGSGKI